MNGVLARQQANGCSEAHLAGGTPFGGRTLSPDFNLPRETDVERCEPGCCTPESPFECGCSECRYLRHSLTRHGFGGRPFTHLDDGWFVKVASETKVPKRCECRDCLACSGRPKKKPEPTAGGDELDDSGMDDDNGSGSDEVEDFGPEAYWGHGDGDY